MKKQHFSYPKHWLQVWLCVCVADPTGSGDNSVFLVPELLQQKLQQLQIAPGRVAGLGRVHPLLSHPVRILPLPPIPGLLVTHHQCTQSRTSNSQAITTVTISPYISIYILQFSEIKKYFSCNIFGVEFWKRF